MASTVCGLAVSSVLTLGCASSPCTATASTTKVRGELEVGALSVRAASPDAHPAGAPYARQPFADEPHRGVLDLSLVTAEVQRRLGDLDDCYQRRLAVKPELSGAIVIHWVITESGEVPDSCITKDTIGDGELTACVNRLVLGGDRFPAPRGGSADVELPIDFTAHAALASR